MIIIDINFFFLRHMERIGLVTPLIALQENNKVLLI